MSRQNFTPWQAWANCDLTGWHQTIEELAQQAWDAVDNEEWLFVSQGLEDARQAGKISEALERAFHHVFWKTLRVAGVYGYALARTYPSGLDEFEDWPRRALELAGLPAPKVEASEGDDHHPARCRWSSSPLLCRPQGKSGKGE